MPQKIKANSASRAYSLDNAPGIGPEVTIPQTGVIFSANLNEVYLRGQAHAMGLEQPLDPASVNGRQVIHAARTPLPHGDYNGKDWQEEREWSEYRASLPDALASSEKQELAGVPFN